jgi:hypothetical protein
MLIPARTGPEPQTVIGGVAAGERAPDASAVKATLNSRAAGATARAVTMVGRLRLVLMRYRSRQAFVAVANVVSVPEPRP